MVADWVFEERLELFLRAVSQFVGYRFDQTDWLAITTQLERNSEESVVRATYDLATVKVELEGDPDGGVVSFRLDGPQELEERILGAHAAIQLLGEPPVPST